MTSGTAAAGGAGVRGTAGASGAVAPRRLPALEAAELAERIAETVAALPDVAGLTSGPSDRVVTYRVGRPVTGVAVRADEIEVGVVVRGWTPALRVADSVRGAVLPAAGTRPVNVLIGDIGEIDDGAGG